MIKIYRTSNKVTKEIQRMKKNCWIQVTKPTEKEIHGLKDQFNIPIEFIRDPLDPHERARTEKEDNITLIIIRIPKTSNADPLIKYVTIPLGIILLPDRIITICLSKIEFLENFANNLIKNFSTKKRSRFVLQILHRTAITFLNYLKDINQQTSLVEKELHQSMRNEELIELLYIEKSLVYFTTSLKSNEFMMERLNNARVITMYEDDKDLLEDVIIENKQAIEMANIYSNILSGMMDAFASVISNNLNIVMKFLTSITIILMIPTLVASIYGMNIHLPLQNLSGSFIYLMIISFGLSIIVVFIFLKRKIF
ncbi:MAG: magnesium transporter CorA family protein [Spirochaetes bacterium]|nr:magnesium transporter CorA family protein [Spirochaetota bacterium]